MILTKKPRKVKSIGYTHRPRYIAKIRGELLAYLLKTDFTKIKNQMYSKNLSLQSLEDCENLFYSFFTK